VIQTFLDEHYQTERNPMNNLPKKITSKTKLFLLLLQKKKKNKKK
jgi:hypothetical protein